MQNSPEFNTFNNLIFFSNQWLLWICPSPFKPVSLPSSNIILTGILIFSRRQYLCHDGLGQELIARTDGPGKSPPKGMWRCHVHDGCSEVREGSMLPRFSGDSETTRCDLNSNWLIYLVNLIDEPHSFWIGKATCCIFPIHELILQFRKVASCSKQKNSLQVEKQRFFCSAHVFTFACVQAIFTQEHRR